MVSKRFSAGLKSRSEFQFLFKQGRRIHGDGWLILNFKENGLDYNRFGWTIPKFVGTAVIRNRFKRWCREFAREHQRRSGKNMDINIVLKRRSKDYYKQLQYEEFKQILAEAYRKIKG